MTGTLVTQLHALGVLPGDTILVHSSFSKIRPVDGGPQALIEALIASVGADGTVVMPSWTGEDDEVFDPTSTAVEDHLGIIPELFRQRDDVVRGTHPFAVAAWGKHAEWIAAAPFVLPPHAPDSGVARVHEKDGKVLLLGVDHDADTTIHLAELTFGVPYSTPKHITVEEHGEAKRVDYRENDHCCRGFNAVGGWLRERGLQREGTVGDARAMLARSRDIVATVVEELGHDPTRFLCERGTCDECDETWLSAPA